MIFQHTHKQVLAATKTQTRRLVQEGDTVHRQAGIGGNSVIDRVYHKGRLKYQVGKTYAVQHGRGKASVGRIKLLSIRRERVNEITEADAIAESVQPINSPHFGPLYKPAFCGLWNEIHTGKDAYENGPSVWVLEFELVT